MYRFFYTIAFLLSSLYSYSQISSDSCWTLLRGGYYDALLDNLNSDDYQTYFFRAKINRQKGELKEGIQNIQKALSYFKTDDRSAEYANSLEEYAVLSRLSEYRPSAPIDALLKSISVRKQLQDSAKLALAYLYMGNTFVKYDSLYSHIDSALKYYSLASDHYTDEDVYDKVILLHNIGHLYSEQGQYDSAIQAYDESGKILINEGNIEEYLWAELGKVDVYLTQEIVDKPELILNDISQYNVDSLLFLKKAILSSYIDLYKLNGRYKEALFLVDSLEEINHNMFNAQQQEADAKYNNERLELQLAKEELETRQHRSTIIYLGILIAALSILFSAYTYIQMQKKKLKEQQFLLKQQETLQAERNRIASEMHDDLGGGLTTIKFVSQSVLRRTENENEKERLQKIVNHSNQLVANMSEIIWAMNSKFDTLESTVAYMRRYATTFLSDHNVPLEIDVIGDMRDRALTSIERRNLLLVMKEAFNNIVKHAQATLVRIEFKYESKNINIKIKDNGTGLLSDNLNGNGLDNMRERITVIGGEIKYDFKKSGTSINIKLNQNQ